MKLFINPGPVLHVLHLQGPINLKHKELFERISQRLQTRDELDALNFEMFNNLVVEATRLGIEVKNLKMQVESLSTRLDFDERRARALEGVVQYRPGTPVAPAPAEEGDEEAPAGTAGEAGEGRGPRRRRRRRGRRRGQGGALETAVPGGIDTAPGSPDSDQADSDQADSDQADQDDAGVDDDGEPEAAMEPVERSAAPAGVEPPPTAAPFARDTPDDAHAPAPEVPAASPVDAPVRVEDEPSES